MIDNFETEFLAFCRSKPADERYIPSSVHRCALGQFVEGLGYVGGSVTYYSKDSGDDWRYPADVRLLSVHGVSQLGPDSIPDESPVFTLGALVKRLELAGITA